MTEKSELRKKLRADIADLGAEYIRLSDIGLFEGLAALPEVKAARTALAYYSIGREPDTIRAIRHMLDLGKTVALPFCEKGGIMHAQVISSLEALRPALLGIPAPDVASRRLAPRDIDLVIVPGLAFDLDGYRLGYGGGYYDRYLPQTRAALVGLTRERTLLARLPRQGHDRRVHCVVTEEKVLRLQ